MSAWHFVSRYDIDSIKWDGIVQQFGHGLSYAFSWYLDIVCKQWEALILGDYEAICPLPFNRKKFGFRQLYRPFFVQQLGWISAQTLNEAQVSSLFKNINQRYFFIHYACHENNMAALKSMRSFTQKRNSILDLSKDYMSIYQSYSKGLRYSLKKASKLSLKISQTESSDKLTHLFQSRLGGKIQELNQKDYHRMSSLVDYCLKNNHGQLWEVKSPKSEVLSMAFFLLNDRRMINLFQVSTPEGREANAISFLFDQLIKSRANSQLIFDFEGSEIESVQKFIRSFGAEERPYPWLEKRLL